MYEQKCFGALSRALVVISIWLEQWRTSVIRLYVYCFGRMKDVGECEHSPACVAVSLQYMSLLRTLILICPTNSN